MRKVILTESTGNLKGVKVGSLSNYDGDGGDNVD